MLRVSLAAVAVIVSVATASAHELIVVNGSQYAIHKLYVALSKSKKWGSDQLGTEHLGIPVFNTMPEAVKIVDEDDDSCVASGINFNQDKEWTLTDEIIENCEGDE